MANEHTYVRLEKVRREINLQYWVKDDSGCWNVSCLKILPGFQEFSTRKGKKLQTLTSFMKVAEWARLKSFCLQLRISKKHFKHCSRQYLLANSFTTRYALKHMFIFFSELADFTPLMKRVFLPSLVSFSNLSLVSCSNLSVCSYLKDIF